MKKCFCMMMFTLSFCLTMNVRAEQVGHYYLEGVSAVNVAMYGLNHKNTYAVSCTSTYAALSRVQDEVDKLSLHVNPGEVTDRHGRHGVDADYDFGVPVGTASFFAQPDAGGNIDFSIVNTLPQTFEVLCNLNLQD